MKLWKVGEKSKAICPFCQQMRTSTFRERDVPLSSGEGVVREVLVGVCDTCDRVVSVPQQSVPRVKETVRNARHSLEARIPRHLIDALNLVCHDLGFGPECSVVVFRYYLQRASQRESLRRNLGALASSGEAAGKATARFSAKLNDELYKSLQNIEKSGHLKDADVVKGLIVRMKRDVLDKRSKAVRRDLQQVMRLAG